MSRFFDPDSPIMRFLSRVADLIILNFLTLLCALPIVTAGASFSAMYYVELKWVRKEEGYAVRPFFRQFRDNLKQATGEWLLMLAAFVIIGVDLYLFYLNPDVFPKVLQYLVIAFAIFTLLVSTWVFLLQSHFVNSVRATLRNAAILAIAKFPRSIAMVLVWAASLLLLYLSLTTVLMMAFPIVLMFFISLPGYLCCKLADAPFSALEPEKPAESETEDEEEKEEAYRVLREESAIRRDQGENPDLKL